MRITGLVFSLTGICDDQSDNVLVILPEEVSCAQLVRETLHLVRQSFC